MEVEIARIADRDAFKIKYRQQDIIECSFDKNQRHAVVQAYDTLRVGDGNPYHHYPYRYGYYGYQHRYIHYGYPYRPYWGFGRVYGCWGVRRAYWGE